MGLCTLKIYRCLLSFRIEVPSMRKIICGGLWHLKIMDHGSPPLVGLNLYISGTYNLISPLKNQETINLYVHVSLWQSFIPIPTKFMTTNMLLHTYQHDLQYFRMINMRQIWIIWWTTRLLHIVVWHLKSYHGVKKMDHDGLKIQETAVDQGRWVEVQIKHNPIKMLLAS